MSVATTSRSVPRMRVASFAVVIAGAVAAGVAQVAGAEDGLPATLATVADLSALATLVWFVIVRRPASLFPWIVLIVSLLVTSLATMVIRSDLTTDAGALQLLRLVADAGYVATVGAFVLIAASLGVARDRADIVDGMIAALAMSAIAWTLVEGPTSPGLRHAAYFDPSILLRPALGVILVGGTVALFFRVGRVSPAIVFLTGATVFKLFVDTVGAASQAHIVPALPLGGIALEILGSTCLAATLIDPSAIALVREEPTGVPFSPRARIAVLSTAAAAASICALYGVVLGESLVVSALTDAIAGIIVLLFALRVWLLTGTFLRTRADLDERTTFLSGIADAMPGAIFRGDASARVIDYASPGFTRSTGWPESDFLAKPGWLLEHMHPDDAPAFRAGREALIAGGDAPSSFEFRLRHADGTYRTFLANLRLVGSTEVPGQYLAVAIDITEQAETRRRLSESERLVADIARTSRALVIAGEAGPDRVGHFDFVSPSIRDILGYDPKAVEAAPGFFRTILHPGDEPTLDDAFEAIARGETSVEGVRRFRSATGEYRSLLLSASLAPGPSGAVRFVYSGIDITDRIRLEDELRRAREFFDELIAASPGMIFSGRSQPPIIDFASPRITDVLGYRPEEVVGVEEWFSRHIHPDDLAAHIEALDAARRAGGGEATRTLRIAAKDGAWRSLLYDARVTADGSYAASAIDVTESVRAEQELARSRRLIEDIISTNPGMLLSGRLAPRVIDFVSDGLLTLMGYTPGEVVGVVDWVPDHMHPDDLPGHGEMLRRLVADRGGVATSETRMLAADGTWRDLLVSTRLSIDPEAGPVYFTSAIDVTARKQAEVDLRRSRDFVASLVTTSPGLIIEGPAGRDVLDYVSPSVERFLGYREDEIVGVVGWTDEHLHPDDHVAFAAAIAGAKATPGKPTTASIRLRGKDRWYRPLVISVLAIVGPDGEMRLIATGVDVGESVRLQEEAREARAFIESILATTPGLIYRGRLGADVFDYVSPGVQEVLGYDPGEIIGVEGWPSAHRDPDWKDDASAGIEELAAGDAPGFTIVQRFRTKSGDWRSLLCIGRFDDPEADDRAYVATAIDITDRITMEEDLRAARDAAEATDRAKSEFLSLISHELRTPLNSILGFGGLLDGSDLPAEDRESVECIIEAGKRLLGLIDRMLDYARLETGRLRVNAGPVILDDVVHSAVERVRPFAEDRHVSIDRAPDSVTGLVAMADGPRLISVVEDLVDNAVRHGGRDVHVSVATAPGTDGHVAIVVADDGVGMTELTLADAFDPLARDAAGTGATLGLALSRRLVEAMGGTLAIRSALGSGTVVRVEVPALDETAEDALAGSATGAR